VVGLSGYLPRGRQIRRQREGYVKDGTKEGEGSGKMKVFLAHGTKDMLVPMRVFRDAKSRVAHTVGEEQIEAHEYQGMGHVTSGPEFRDMCAFLEKIIP
jgi:predicted esterase